MAITVKQLQALGNGKWKSDGGPRGVGVLAFRRTASNEIFAYFRYTLPSGKRDSLPIAKFSADGSDGLSLSELRKEAGELSKLYQSGIRDLRKHQENEAAKAQAFKLAEEERASQLATQYTLKNLCTHYAEYLESRGKSESARQARSLFKVWIYSDPQLANTPAKSVSSLQLAAAIRKPREAGKIRTAGILRSYLLAAFNAAWRAPTDTGIPEYLTKYGVESNPCQIVVAIPIATRERTLSEEELRSYIRLLGTTTIDKTLKLALYSGGQRIAQLLRAKVEDFADGNLQLLDTKGRRATPRKHILPLAPTALAILTDLKSEACTGETDRAAAEKRPPVFQSLPLFSARTGHALAATSIGRRIKELALEIGNSPFDARDIRRTVETMMAELGISKEIRAQLLSHGLGGVQDKHYDRYAYLKEKREALLLWEEKLSSMTSDNHAAEVEHEISAP